jgi:hypothetical protein
VHLCGLLLTPALLPHQTRTFWAVAFSLAVAAAGMHAAVSFTQFGSLLPDKQQKCQWTECQSDEYGYQARGCHQQRNYKAHPVAKSARILQVDILLLQEHLVGWYADQLVSLEDAARRRQCTKEDRQKVHAPKCPEESEQAILE